MTADPVRVVVWSSGGVGSIAIDAIRGRPDLELVGVWVHSPAKVGRDVGELAGGSPIGVAATNDSAALIALRPECVVYAASGPQRDTAAVPDYVRLLESGINVVSTTSTSLVYPPAYFHPEWRERLDVAAKAGDASFYASGIFPGFGSDQLALVLADPVQGDSYRDGNRGGAQRPLPGGRRDDGRHGVVRSTSSRCLLPPGFIEMAWCSPIYLIADALGARVQQVRGSFDRRVTPRDLQVAFGTIGSGTCGAVRTRAAGVVAGREAIVVEHVIRMARDVAPDWLSSEHDATYRVDIEGDPDIHCAMTLGDARGRGAGRGAMAATAMRVVNAIPYVVDARAGLLSSLDLPITLPRHVLD